MEPDRAGGPSPGPRGFTLLAVSIIGLLVAAAAAALVIVGRESARATNDDDKNAAAWAAAMAGLTWAQLHLDNNVGKTALQSAANGTSATVDGVKIHVFNPDDEFAGVATTPPAVGSSSASWRAFDRGHFALLGADDALSASGVLIRSVGRVGSSQVVLETNLNINVLKSLPGAFTGCFGSTVNITYFDEQSPGDYTASVRYDGNGAVPLGLSADHDRLNGLARMPTGGGATFTDDAPSDPRTDYPTGKRWRGTQSLRSEPLAAAIPGVASAVSTLAGGTPATNMVNDDVGNFPGWDANPYMANDPRLMGPIVAATATADDKKRSGLGLGTDGMIDLDTSATVTQQRGLPLIGYFETPDFASGDFAKFGLFGDDDWADQARDDSARKGFYGCANHLGGASMPAATRMCLTGSATAGATNWSFKGLNHSGRAWGFLSSVLRQCTGSGDAINPDTGDPWFDTAKNPKGIKCSPAFEYLENVAACVVMPKGVGRGNNTLRPSGDGDLANDFRGCHPGCLLAADFDEDGAAETPYRSVCINLDAEVATTYGPDIAQAMTVDPDGTDPLTELPYVRNWLKYAAKEHPKAADGSSGFAAPANDSDALVGNAFVFGDHAVFAKHNPFIDTNNKPRLIKLPGFVRERGNASLITRFDLTDRGPLGTCEQNCLGYGFGRDLTYGAHRKEAGLGGTVGTAAAPQNCSAKVPTEPSGVTQVHCNLDYDRDGALDRFSYAIASSYREECADPHDGVAWSPAVSISTANSALTGGCQNRMPNDAAGVEPVTLTSFCSAGSLNEIQDSVNALLAIASTGNLTALQAKNTLTDGGNWFGGAKCHMGTGITYVGRDDPGLHPHTGAMAGVSQNDLDTFGHPDFWIEDSCPDPQIVKVSGASLSVGTICGCGVLVLDDIPLVFGSGSHLLWRGLVVWNMNTISGDVWNATTDGFSSFVVEGGFLATGNQDFTITITKKDADTTDVDNDDGRANKSFFRMNPLAIQQALTGQQKPLRSVRRIQ